MNIENSSAPERKYRDTPQENLTSKGNPCSASVHVTPGYYITRLAEELATSEQGYPCDMCAIGNCDSQVSGMTCLGGVTAWLRNQAEAFAQDSAEREAAYFSYLDSLSGVQKEDAVSLMETRFPHFKMSVGGARVIIEEWQARKGLEAL